MKVNYGPLVFKLTGDIYFTGKQLPFEGQEEFSAPGVDQFGNEVTVFWVREYEPGVELDEIDFYTADNVEYQ